jgi:hypothetical protein
VPTPTDKIFDLYFGTYVFARIELQVFNEILHQMNCQPFNDIKSINEFKNTIGNVYGILYSMRQRFTYLYDCFSTEDFHPRLTAEQIVYLQQVPKADMKFTYFAGFILIYASLDGQEWDTIPARTIYALMSASETVLSTLGISLSGRIDICFGMEAEERFLYAPLLPDFKADGLQPSHLVIGEELRHYLKRNASMSEANNEWSLMNQRYAIQCLKMISGRRRLAIAYSRGRSPCCDAS